MNAVKLKNTTTAQISRAISRQRKEGGFSAAGRVLTLIIQTGTMRPEEIIDAAVSASREHPCRVVVIVENPTQEEPNLDAEIRIGGDAGAAEVIILRPAGVLATEPEALVSALLLPDAPVVVWWPDGEPDTSSRSLGHLATRRITDVAMSSQPHQALIQASQNYQPGDTDLSWTRLTLWRAQIAAIFDGIQARRVSQITVEGDPRSPSVILLAAWLNSLLGARVTVADAGTKAVGVSRIRITRPEGDIELHRVNDRTAELFQPETHPQHISLPLRSLADCLAEELRRLDADEMFEAVLKDPVIRKPVRSVRPSGR